MGGVHGDGDCVRHSINSRLENQIQQTSRNEGPREPPSPCLSCHSNSLTRVWALMLLGVAPVPLPPLPSGPWMLPPPPHIPVCPFSLSLTADPTSQLEDPVGQYQLLCLCLGDLGFERARISPFRVATQIPRSSRQQQVVHTLNVQKWPFSFSL